MKNLILKLTLNEIKELHRKNGFGHSVCNKGCGDNWIAVDVAHSELSGINHYVKIWTSSSTDLVLIKSGECLYVYDDGSYEVKPEAEQPADPEENQKPTPEGAEVITLRDRFALAVAGTINWENKTRKDFYTDWARRIYPIADALMEARNKLKETK